MFLKDSVPYKCRFCGETKTPDEFSQKAHAVAECVGNKCIFTEYECDECNQKFSILENELGKLLQFYKANLNFQGKKGKIKLLGTNIDLNIETREYRSDIDFNNSPIEYVLMDESKGETIIKQKDIVINFRKIYFALIKFALSVINEKMSKELEQAFKLLKDEDQLSSYLLNIITWKDNNRNHKIAIYENEQATNLPKYFCTIDAYHYTFIVYLDLNDNMNFVPYDIIRYCFDDKEVEDISIADYFAEEDKLSQTLIIKGNISNKIEKQ